MRSPHGPFRITQLGFLGLTFLVCFTTKLKLLNIASTSQESLAQHWHSHDQNASGKSLKYTHTESFPESGLPYSQYLTAELGPHVMSDAPRRQEVEGLSI